MNDSLHGTLGEPPDASLHDALHAAAARSAAEHEAAGYRVPEAAVRAKARRRRTLRAASASTLSLALLAGAGVAVAQLGSAPAATYRIEPHGTPTPRDAASGRPHRACGTDFITTLSPDSWFRVYADGWPLDLRVGVGQAPDVTVLLENEDNETGDTLLVEETEGPVLLALDEESVVVGYSRLETPPGVVLLQAGEGRSYTGFGPMYRCPGVGDVATDPYLDSGRYTAYVGQLFSYAGYSLPLSMWERIGELTVTPEPEPAETAAHSPPPRAGECRSSLESLDQNSGASLGFDEPQPVLAVVGAPFDPRVTLSNHGPLDVEDAAQVDPVLLVLDGEGRVTARSQPFDPVPDGALAAGQSLTFAQFEPLTDCVTGEPLAPGAYEFHLARLVRDPESRSAVDLLSRWGTLAVTADADASRTQVELPVLPTCGESIDGFAFDSAFPAGAARFAGRASWSIEDERLVEDPGGGPAVTYEFTYDGPTHELTFLDENVVLVRDGVVVADEYTGGWGGAQPETWTDGDTRTAAFTIFHDCAAEEDYTEFEPTGPYTILGFTVYDYIDEFGLPNYVVATLGPTEVDFGER